METPRSHQDRPLVSAPEASPGWSRTCRTSARASSQRYIYIYMVPPPLPYPISLPISLLLGAVPNQKMKKKLKKTTKQIKNKKTNPKKQQKQKNKKLKFLRTSLSLSLCCQKPKNKKTKKQNYVRYDHILVPNSFFWGGFGFLGFLLFWLFCFFLFFCFFVVFLLFLFFFLFFGFFGFLFFLFFWFSGFDTLVEHAPVDTNSPCFWQPPRAFSVIFGNVPKQSESSKIFGNRICRSPRRGLIRNQFVSSSCYGLHTNTFN